MKNDEYWENFYQGALTLNPSDFCTFVLENYGIIDKEIIDVCSGNGRDTYALGLNAMKTTGVDFANKPEDTNKVSFIKSDINKYLSDKSNLIIYSRFGIHAFDEQTENNVIDSAKELYLEFRSDKDDQFVSNHYRRLINGNKFLDKLIKKNFEIKYFIESNGLAVYEQFDPVVIRVVAYKRES